MRIISGNLGGRKFNGKIPPGVRPTSDIARGSVFNKLQNIIDFDGAIIADICAGTGSMGIECISRGAKFCAFVDSSRKSCDYIKQALDNFNIPKDTYTIINKKSDKFSEYFNVNFPKLKFDIIISDPPYIENVINTLLDDILKYELLNKNGIIVVEYSSNRDLIIPEAMELIDNKIFGETKLSYIQIK